MDGEREDECGRVREMERPKEGEERS